VKATQVDEIRQKLIAACDQALAEGLVMEEGITFRQDGESGHCCPLGAFARQDNIFACSEALGLDNYDAELFARGFDDETTSRSYAAKLGREFRERYLS